MMDTTRPEGDAPVLAPADWGTTFQRLDAEQVAAALQLSWATIDGRAFDRHVEAFRAADLAMREHLLSRPR